MVYRQAESRLGSAPSVDADGSTQNMRGAWCRSPQAPGDPSADLGLDAPLPHDTRSAFAILLRVEHAMLRGQAPSKMKSQQ